MTKTKIISDFILKHYTTEVDTNIGIIPICALCGNSGIIDTKFAKWNGKIVGGKFPCLCYNGMAIRLDE